MYAKTGARILFARIVAGLIAGGARLITGAQARWRGCGPEARQRIYVANHQSHLDFVLLWSALPPGLRNHTRPVAAADYWGSGALRRYISGRVFNAVLITRGGGHNNTPNDPMLEALNSGDSLILFPEGTRGDGREVAPFKAGVFHLAQARRDVQLIPVWMHNAGRVMPKGSLFPAPLLCSATFGAPVAVLDDEPKTEFLERLRSSVAALEDL